MPGFWLEELDLSCGASAGWERGGEGAFVAKGLLFGIEGAGDDLGHAVVEI